MRDYKSLSREAYNKKANNYEQTSDGKFTAAFKTELLGEMQVPRNSKVLDVACGTGVLLNQLYKRYEIEAYGVDIAEDMIKVAKSRYPHMKFQVGDSASLQFDDGFFDIVTVCASFHHFPEPRQFINEAMRVLSKGGRIYIAEIYLPPVIREVFNVFLPFLKSGDVKIYTPKEMKRMFEPFVGLKDFKIKRIGCIQILTAVKK